MWLNNNPGYSNLATCIALQQQHEVIHDSLFIKSDRMESYSIAAGNLI